jgi:hypothetical protein
MWKACHILLSTKENLFKRIVVQNKLCPCCGKEEKSILHALWGCPSAQDVWGYTVGVWGRILSCCLNIFWPGWAREIWTYLLAIVARKIWLRRNSLVFDGKFIHPNILFSEAVSACYDFCRCNMLPLPTVSVEGGGPVPNHSWQAPSSGVTKINWDASLNKSTGCISPYRFWLCRSRLDVRKNSRELNVSINGSWWSPKCTLKKTSYLATWS